MKLLLAIIFSTIMLCCVAQQRLTIPTAKRITQFPFTMLTGGTVIIQAQLDGIADTLNFVLDTGSGGISLDSSTVENLQLKRSKSERTISGIAGVRKVDFVYKHSLKLQGLMVDSLDFHINNYDILTAAYGIKIDGVIGFSFLRRYIVKVNYDEHLIQVYSPGSIKYPSSGYILHPNFTSLAVINNNIFDHTQSRGSFIFDTGAGLNMLLSNDYVADSAVLHKKRKQFTTQAEGLGGKKIMNLTVLRKVTVGPYKFRWVPVYIFNDDYNVTSYPQTDGVIGNDILRRFNLIINYPNKEIHLKPNTHFYDDFDYSYTGLGLYQINGEIVVENVIEKSPGDKAGFKQNDLIFAVDNNFTHSLQAYKQALQNAGNTIKVLVMRNGEALMLNLEIQHIMH